MNKILLLAALAATALPSAAIARGTTLAPPGNSAVNQYLESVPTASGPRPANTIHVGGGVGGGGSGGSGGGGGGAGSSSAIPASTQQALSRQGSDGLAAAALVRATAPTNAASPAGHGGTTSASTGAAPTSGQGSGSSAVATLVNALTGGSSQGGLGPVLPAILVAGAIAAVVLAAVRRRRHHDT